MLTREVSDVLTGAGRAVSPRKLTFALCLVQFVDVMCVTIVVTALPQMISDFGGATDSSVIATAYATFFGGLLLFGARVGERLGHRRSILASIAVFAAAAALAALAPSAFVLASARALQGAAAACAVPSALALLTSLAPDDRHRARAIAAWSASGAAAGIAGYLVAGTFAQFGDWRLIFWSLLAISALLAILVLMYVPDDVVNRSALPFNALGALTVTTAIMLVVVGASVLDGLRHWLLALGLFACASIAAAAFLAVDRRSRNPLVPSAFAKIGAVRWGSATAFVNTATTSGGVTVLTLYLQNQLGYSPLAAAAILIPMSALVIAGSVTAGRFDSRVGTGRAGTVGMGFIALGLSGLTIGSPQPVAMLTATAAMGFGLGLSSVASTSTGLSVPGEQRTIASGLVNTAAQLGTAIGTAVLLLLSSTFDGSSDVSISDPVVPRVAWSCAALTAACTALVWFYRTVRERHTGSKPPT